MTNERKIEYLTKMLGILNSAELIQYTSDIYQYAYKEVRIFGLCHITTIAQEEFNFSHKEALIIDRLIREENPTGFGNSTYWLGTPWAMYSGRLEKRMQKRKDFLKTLIAKIHEEG